MKQTFLTKTKGNLIKNNRIDVGMHSTKTIYEDNIMCVILIIKRKALIT